MAIAIDATTTDFNGSSHSSRTTAHTCAGTNRYLKVAAGCRQTAGQTVTGVTYNGVAMTLKKAHDLGTNTIHLSVWELVAPATGVANVVVTWSAAVAAATYVINSYTDVDQTTPSGTEAFSAAIGTTPSDAPSSSTGNLVVDSLVLRENSVPTKDASQTLRGNVSAGVGSGFCESADSEEAHSAGSSTTMSWTLSVSVSYVHIAYALKPASGTPPATSSTLPLLGAGA